MPCRNERARRAGFIARHDRSLVDLAALHDLQRVGERYESRLVLWVLRGRSPRAAANWWTGIGLAVIAAGLCVLAIRWGFYR